MKMTTMTPEFLQQLMLATLLADRCDENGTDYEESTYEHGVRDALQWVAVFDHPDRSQRGRTITHAHYFDLGDAPFPAVRADDDAMQVEWVPVEKLAAMEEEFFEDHFHMLDHFLVLTTPP